MIWEECLESVRKTCQDEEPILTQFSLTKAVIPTIVKEGVLLDQFLTPVRNLI